MTTFPLTALLLSRSLIYGLARYAADIRILRRTLLVRVGWQRGMALHNAMVVAAFLLIGLALALGLPLFIGLPPLILLPLGLVQIWQMRRIADGAKPNWRVLGVSASALFAITAYLFTFAFWTR
jgi:1,4-dihydroxy-2-naphthoate octaprenyltransferase